MSEQSGSYGESSAESVVHGETGPPSGMVAGSHRTPVPWSEKRPTRRSYLACLTLLVFAVAIAALAQARIETTFNPAYILPTLNILFLTLVSFLVSVVAARSYFARPSMAVLLLGSGTLALGFGAALSALGAGGPGANPIAATYNVLALLAGLCHLASGAVSLRSGSVPKRSGRTALVASYLLIAVLALAAVLLIRTEVWPEHFVQGVGATVFGKTIARTAAGLFALSAILMGFGQRKGGSNFRLWYALGLGLIALGLVGVSFQLKIGDPVNLVSRGSQYLGGICILISVFPSLRGRGAWTLWLQRALRETEDRYQRLVDLSPEAVLVHSKGEWAFANPAARRMFGASSSEELVDKPLMERIHPDYRELVEQQIDRAYDGVGGPSQEIKFLRLDGSPVDGEMVCAKVDFKGKPAIQTIVRDISERKRAEEALRESEALLRGLFDAMPSGCAIYEVRNDGARGTDYIIRYFNAASLAIEGKILEEIVGKSLGDLRPAIDEYGLIPIFRQVWLTGETAHYPAKAYVDETYTNWYENHVFRLPSGEIVAIYDDVTERVRATQALRESEEKFRSFAEQTSDLISLTDSAGIILYASPASTHLFGVDPEEMTGCHFSAFLDESAIRTAVAAFRAADEQGRRTDNLELRMKRKDGSTFIGEVRGGRRHAASEAGTLVTIRDVTKRKRLEEERLQLERQLQQSQKLESLGVLAGGIAHDFNNILTTVLGNADLALTELSPAAPAREGLLAIMAASRRATGLCRQMLAYSGRGHFVIETIDLGALVTDMLGLLMSSISKKALLNLNLEKNLPLIEGDPSQISQVMMNLVMNASEAIGDEDGVITISTGARECSRQYLRETYVDQNLTAGLYLTLEVSDTGCGMDAETQERIFEPFFTTKFTGRGLGLAAVLGIVRGHKGALKLYSEPGQGSTFTMLFPASELSAEPYTGKSGKQIGDWQGQGIVLLVDDEEAIRAVGARMLERLGFEVLLAADGREALETYRKHGPEISLVLLDLTMPHMDGEETFKKLRQMDTEVRVVISSGFTETDVTSRFVGQGLAGFMQKPYALAELRQGLRVALSEETGPEHRVSDGPGGSS